MRKLSRIRIAVLLFCAGFTIWFWFCLPRKLFNDPASFVIEDSKGNLLNASIAADGQWRFSDYTDVPEKFKKCIVTFEDKRFKWHPGVDPFAIGRAIIANLRGKPTQGGSTITMQIIRLSRKNNQRNIFNKIIESIQALRLEIKYSKDKILSLYASHAPFGGNVVGLEAASWRYYGRKSESLSWGEMAALAVLPNSPALVHPGRNSKILKRKRDFLLDKLKNEGIIDSTTAELSKLEPLPSKPFSLPEIAPHLLQRFRNDFVKGKFKSSYLKTSVDIRLQSTVADILQSRQNYLRSNSINNSCALVLDVKTGKALAYVGNVYDPKLPQFETSVDVIKAPRSPGSALKPVLYSLAMSEGLILPHSLLPDIPTQIGGYSPQNFDQSFDGAVPASLALSRSLNIPAVKLLQQYKYSRFYDALKQFGITTLNKPADHYGLSIILGGSEVTMWDMAGMYASMARSLLHSKVNNGEVRSSDFFAPVYSNENKRNYKAFSTFSNLDPVSIYYAFEAMKDVMRPGEEGLWQQFNSSQKIAWKTGTSFGFRDAWAVGITPKYVVAVWVGNTTGEGRAGLVGIQAAAPIMFDIFKKLPSSGWFEFSVKNAVKVAVCRESGFRATADCPQADSLFASPNAVRSPLCTYHKIIHLDRTKTFRANENCESPSFIQNVSWFVLPPAMEFYYRLKNPSYKELPPFKAGCRDADLKSIDLIYPTPEARIYVPFEISGNKGNVIFKAVHRKSNAKLFWTLDNNYLGETLGIHQISINPSSGRHTLVVVDENGESIRRGFTIVSSDNK